MCDTDQCSEVLLHFTSPRFCFVERLGLKPVTIIFTDQLIYPGWSAHLAQLVDAQKTLNTHFKSKKVFILEKQAHKVV